MHVKAFGCGKPKLQGRSGASRRVLHAAKKVGGGNSAPTPELLNELWKAFMKPPSNLHLAERMPIPVRGKARANTRPAR